MLLSSDTSVGISKSMGLAQISFAEVYEELKPDMLVVLGDRYEIFSAVSAAMIARVPVAHLHGGETTEGAFDESIRHSITKMSHLHFTATDEYKNRVIQLGEHPARVFNVGGIGIENIKRLNAEGVVISGCGKNLSANIDPEAINAKVIKSDFSIKASTLLQKMAEFYTQCELYEQTGCVHTAKLYIDEDTFFIGEDIAQHNTIDKAIAKALLAGADVTKSFLMVSGRLSSEMVAKAIMHQIPILASRTASTCLGLMIAQKFGLTLVGFVRGDRMNIYKNEGRIRV